MTFQPCLRLDFSLVWQSGATILAKWQGLSSGSCTLSYVMHGQMDESDSCKSPCYGGQLRGNEPPNALTLIL